MAPPSVQAWFEDYKKIWSPPFRLEDYLNLHTEDVVYNDVTIPKVFHTKKEVREFYVRVLEAFPNFTSRYDRYFQQDDAVITEGALVGDQTKPYRGNPPSNRHVECPWIQILHFRGDKICEVHDYYDRLDFLRQMGILEFDFTGQPIAKTGGVYKAGPA